jgi:ketosteroid isomerase-like protein
MTDQSNENRAALDRFLSAWATHDPEAVLQAVHPDFVYSSSVGPEPGSTWRTQTEVRDGLCAMFAYDAGSDAQIDDIVIVGDVGFQTWVYRSKKADGSEEVSKGCDLLHFRDGKLVYKNAFRKVKTPPLIDAQQQAKNTAAEVRQGRYAPRHVAFHGVWHFDAIDLKVYGISVSGDGIDNATLEAARRHVHGRMPEIEGTGGSENVGFVVIHAGKDATWLLLSWWANTDIRCQLLSANDPGLPGTVFKPVTQPFSSCVWEQVVINAESQAWVRAMSQEHLDKHAYLEDRLASGEY